MSTEKEQNQTKENQFRLQKYVWWPWSTKVRVVAIAIVTLAFFLGTTIRIERLVDDKNEGDNIQWLVDWMKSPESQKKLMNLRCAKVNNELRCTRQPEEGNGHAENSKQSQQFFLRLDDLKGDQNQSENSLCCRPCRHSPGKPIYEIIYEWLFQDCNHHSVTLSNKFEYELKRMLEYELQLLQKNTEFQTLVPKCKTNLFKTNFDNILSKTLKEISLEKPTHSIENVIFTYAQKYVWWPWSTKVRVIAIAIVTLAFFLGTTIRIERHLVGDKKEGDNIQWLVDWMKSPESQNKLMNLRCEKVNDVLRCTRQSEEGNGHAENSKQSQWFFLCLDDLKGEQNQSENSLCCRPCRHSPSNDSASLIVCSRERYKKIYNWLLQKIKKNAVSKLVRMLVSKLVGNDCKHHSVTLSNKFEYELIRMLEYELQLLQKNTEFQKLSPKCKIDLFETKFHDILSKTLKEVFLKKSTHSTEQVIFTSQVEQREEQVVYAKKYSTSTSTGVSE